MGNCWQQLVETPSGWRWGDGWGFGSVCRLGLLGHPAPPTPKKPPPLPRRRLLLLPQVPGLEAGAPWVAFGKHLCGAATDFTLRSCAREHRKRLQHGQQQGGGQQQQAAGAAPGGVRGLAVATCCHHRCSWRHFVAQEVMLQQGFSPQEFEVIAWMTGRDTCLLCLLPALPALPPAPATACCTCRACCTCCCLSLQRLPESASLLFSRSRSSSACPTCLC